MHRKKCFNSSEELINKAIFGIKVTHNQSKEIYDIIYELEPTDKSLLKLKETIKDNLLKLTVYSSICEKLLEQTKEEVLDLRDPTSKPYTESKKEKKQMGELLENSNKLHLFVNKEGKLTF